MEKSPEIFYENTTVPASYMLGGMRFKKGRLAYDFNFTFTRNRTDPFRNISLLVLHDREAVIREVLIHDHIMIIADSDIKGSQNGFLKANSDFNSVSIPLRILGIDDEGLTAGAIVGIVIGGRCWTWILGLQMELEEKTTKWSRYGRIFDRQRYLKCTKG